MRLASPLLVVALAAAASGCAPKVQDTLEIAYVCAPGEDAKACAPTGGTCSKYVSGFAELYLQKTGGGGTITNGLYFFMQVNNQRPNNADESAGRVNTADAQITRVELEYNIPGASVPSYTISAIQETVPAAGSATPFITLIPEPVSEAMQAVLPTDDWTPVDVLVTMKGKYQDGSAFETAPFKVQTHVYNSLFPGMACPKKTDVITAVCPNSGQTSTWTCESSDSGS